MRLDRATCAICMDSLFNKLDDLDELVPIVAPECGTSLQSRGPLGANHDTDVKVTYFTKNVYTNGSKAKKRPTSHRRASTATIAIPRRTGATRRQSVRHVGKNALQTRRASMGPCDCTSIGATKMIALRRDPAPSDPRTAERDQTRGCYWLVERKLWPQRRVTCLQRVYRRMCAVCSGEPRD
jgi:hypothetical protein